MSVQLKIDKDEPDNAQNLRGLPEKGEGGGGARALRVLDKEIPFFQKVSSSCT